MSSIDLSRLELVYEPFPIGVSRAVFEPDLYEQDFLPHVYPRKLVVERGLPGAVLSGVSVQRARAAAQVGHRPVLAAAARATAAEHDGVLDDARRRRPHRSAHGHPAEGRHVGLLHGEAEHWRAEWGGGTDMLRCKDPRKSFNYANAYLGFEETEVLRTFAHEPIQAILFIKTFNSLHGVRPMTGPDDCVRRTLTVNLRRIG